MNYNTDSAPRSQTPFGNARVGETLFRAEGGSAGERGTARGRPRLGNRVPPSQVRSQTEFGNEDLQAKPRSPHSKSLSR